MKTGYEDWDQNLQTLSKSLFPDPSKVAQGYYYGSQARQSQLESNKLIDQQNYRNRRAQMVLGVQQPGPITFQQPTNVPGAAPIAAPADNLPMAGAGPTGLGAAVAAATSMTPQQGVNVVTPAIQAATVGTPPPYGPPSAVSPPAPQTTTSNGQVPTNDRVSGVLHPESLNTTGVPVQASPAAANGSPAPVPPGMTLPGLLAFHTTGELAGIDAATLAGGGQALAYEMRQRNLINDNQFKQMLGSTGQAGPWQQDIQAAASIKGHELTAAASIKGAQIGAGATIGAARIREQEARRADEMAPEKTVDEAGNAIYVSRKDTPGKRAYDSTVANTVAGKQAEYADFIKPDDPTKTVPMTIARGAALGLQRAPASTDAAGALLNTAILRTIDPAEKERLEAERLRVASLPTARVTGAQSFEQMAVNYAADQQAYPQPDPITAVDLTVKDPVALTPAAETAITDRVKAVRRTSRGYVLNDSEARNEARRQLQDEGTLYTPDEINKMRADGIRSWVGRDVRIQTYTPPGGTPGPHMMVGLKPKDGAATTTPPISTVAVPSGDSNRGRARTTAAPAATATPARPAALPSGTVVGPANGASEGKTGTVKETGQSIVVRGNSWVVQ